MANLITSREEHIQKYISRLKCHPDRIQTRLADLIPSMLINRLRQEFYNPLVLQMVMCVITSIIEQSQSSIPVTQRIRHWFQDLEQIGAESVEGFAMRGDLRNVEDAFIVKAPRDPRSEGLIHELFIGLFGTNRLRGVVPNFAYLFGGFECSAPIIQSKNQTIANKVVARDEVEVVSYCEPGVNSNENVPYVIYENIAPAISFRKFCESCTADEFFLSLDSLTLALRRGWINCEYVHNDLHNENVLIWDIGRVMSFPYSTRNGVKYLIMSQIPMIIDQGRAHIKHNNINYGYSGLEDVGVFEDLPLPITDVYKIIMFSLYAMLSSGNMECFNRAKLLLPFFFPQLNGARGFNKQAKEIVIRERENYYYYLNLPRNEDRLAFRDFIRNIKENNFFNRQSVPSSWLIAYEFNFDTFLDYVHQVCQCSFLVDQSVGQVASCRGQACGNNQEILSSFFEEPLTHPPTAEDFFDFYDLYTYSKASQSLKETIRNNFTVIYNQAKEDYLADLAGNILTFRDDLLDIPGNIRLAGQTIQTIYNLADNYRERFVQIASAYHSLTNLEFLFIVGRTIADIYDDDDLYQRISTIQESNQQSVDFLLLILQQINEDRKYWLQSLQNPNFIRPYDYNDRHLEWLRLVFPGAARSIIPV